MKIEFGGSMTLITMLLVILKVTHYISWSWWLVFSPILISMFLVLLFLGVLLTIVVVSAMIEK